MLTGGTGCVRGGDEENRRMRRGEVGALDSSEKTIAILGDRRWPQTATQEGDKTSNTFLCNTWKKRNGQMLEVSLLGVGMVLRIERDAWSVVKWRRQATHEHEPPPPPTLTIPPNWSNAKKMSANPVRRTALFVGGHSNQNPPGTKKHNVYSPIFTHHSWF